MSRLDVRHSSNSSFHSFSLEASLQVVCHHHYHHPPTSQLLPSMMHKLPHLQLLEDHVFFLQFFSSWLFQPWHLSLCRTVHLLEVSTVFSLIVICRMFTINFFLPEVSCNVWMQYLSIVVHPCLKWCMTPVFRENSPDFDEISL